VTLAGSRKDSNSVKNLNICMAVLVYMGFIMKKVQTPHGTKSLDTSQNMALNLAG
jgi:hypothetical protein